MPDSAWRGPVAYLVFGAFLCGISAWIAWFISAQQAEVRMSREQSTRQHIEYAQDRIRDSCIDRDPSAFFECIAIEIVTAHDHGRAERDLDAQEAMALWTQMMTIVGAAGLGVTAFGIYLVWGTLEQTRIAAKAAQDAVEVDRRPNLKVRLAQIVETDGGGFAQVSLENSGETSAEIYRSDFVVYLGDDMPIPKPYDFGSPSSRFWRGTVDAGMFHHWRASIPENADRDRAVLMGGVIYKKPGSSRTYRTFFCRKYDPACKRFVAIKDDPEYERED